MITLGFYQSKHSLNSERPDIIRILGPSKNREGYWLTQDGDEKPEYDLLENYIKLDYTNSEVKPKQVPTKLFEGLSEINHDNIIQQTQQVQQKQEITVSPITQPIIKEIPINFDKAILEKLQIDRLNAVNQEKYGEPLYRTKPILNVSIPIELNYDVKKLQQSIDILNLDAEEIALYIINDIDIEYIRNLIVDAFLSKLEIKQSTEDIQPIVQQSIVQQPKEELLKKDEIVGNLDTLEQIEVYKDLNIQEEPKQISQEHLLEQITQVSKYINDTLFNNNK